jgi:hypothetical protein
MLFLLFMGIAPPMLILANGLLPKMDNLRYQLFGTNLGLISLLLCGVLLFGSPHIYLSVASLVGLPSNTGCPRVIDWSSLESLTPRAVVFALTQKVMIIFSSIVPLPKKFGRLCLLNPSSPGIHTHYLVWSLNFPLSKGKA